jgi:hypothetical protein
MKKIFSLILFILTLAIFALDIYVSIAGAVDVRNHYDELVASGASGHEFLGVRMGIDILAFGVGLISVIGGVISRVSRKIAQHQAVRIASAVMCPLFLLPIFISFLILTCG